MREIRKQLRAIQNQPGGWFKIPGMRDPGAVMLGLVAQVEDLEGRVEALTAQQPTTPPPEDPHPERD